ncbi:signal peptide, large protein [Cryptosporidium felis]|nr:signal peptide, large protein [Cryptosporidium felis]
MLSKRKLAAILPLLFELAASYDYGHFETIPTDLRPANHWGRVGPSDEEKVVKIGSLGGGYYGRGIPGLRDYETGDPKDRGLGSKAKSYPYRLEPERALTNETLAPLSIEARLRMMREPFREYIFNLTGQVPTLKEMKKMKTQFMDFVKKELNITDSQATTLFGIETTKKVDGKLPSYLLFDDMDEFDFDPKEALKYMPRVSSRATKDEVEQAYLKAWEMLGKSNKRLKQVYKAYRKEYIKKNPLGPIMTEKEFLLHSIKLRERVAFGLGFVPSPEHNDPIFRSIEISLFLRNALKDEYEKYKSMSPAERFSSGKNFVNEALFTDDLILDNMGYPNESDREATLPSPYDPIEGRAWTNTTSNSRIVDIKDAVNRAINGEEIRDKRGNLIYKTGDADSDVSKHEHSLSDTEPSILQERTSDAEPVVDAETRSTPFYKVTPIKRRRAIKTPAQLLFEKSEYSTLPQKRVIDRLEDFTLVDINDLSPEQLSKLCSLVSGNFNMEADIKKQKDHYKQLKGEAGGDPGTNTEVYREFLHNKFGNGLFFVPKDINWDLKNVVLPVSATGFEIAEKEGGKAKIHHIASGLSFDIDFSDSESFFTKSYLGDITDDGVSPRISTFVSLDWKISDSQIPSPMRFIRDVDEKMRLINSQDASLDLLKEHIKSDPVNSKKSHMVKVSDSISSYLESVPKSLKEYEDSRDKYIRAQERVMDEIKKSKAVIRSLITLEGLKIATKGLGDSSDDIAAEKLLLELSPEKVESVRKQQKDLEEITEQEYQAHIKELGNALTDMSNSFLEFQNACHDIQTASSRININASNAGDELMEEFGPTLDARQKVVLEATNEMEKLEAVHRHIFGNANTVLSLSKDMLGVDKFLENKEVKNALKGEIMDIIKGNKNVEEYKKIIGSSGGLPRYFIDGKDEGEVRRLDDDEGVYDEGKPKESEVSKYSTDFKGKVKVVFEESLVIIQEFVRDLYIAFPDSKERMQELLKLESFLSRELARHRKSLSVVLNRVALPEDEIIDEEETDELKMRILLKIYEEKTKLIYVTDVIDKLFFFPYFSGISRDVAGRLRRLEEEGISSRFAYSYLPRFRFDEEERPMGIYGYRRIDFAELREDIFQRLSLGFDLDRYRIDLEIVDLLELTSSRELERLLSSPQFAELSLYSKRLKLSRILKSLISTEKSEKRREKLKSAYREIRRWQEHISKLEKEIFGDLYDKPRRSKRTSDKSSSSSDRSTSDSPSCEAVKLSSKVESRSRKHRVRGRD